MHRSSAAEPIRRTSRTTGNNPASSAACAARRAGEYPNPVPSNAIDSSLTSVQRSRRRWPAPCTCAPSPSPAEYTSPALTSATAPAIDTPPTCAATDTE